MGKMSVAADVVVFVIGVVAVVVCLTECYITSMDSCLVCALHHAHRHESRHRVVEDIASSKSVTEDSPCANHCRSQAQPKAAHCWMQHRSIRLSIPLRDWRCHFANEAERPMFSGRGPKRVNFSLYLSSLEGRPCSYRFPVDFGHSATGHRSIDRSLG